MILQHEYTTYDELVEFLTASQFGLANLPDVTTVQMSEDSYRRFSQDMKEQVKIKDLVTPTNIIKTINRTLKIEVI